MGLEESPTPKPATIVFADVVRFSTLVAEAGDLATSQALHGFLDRTARLQQQWHGRMVKIVGDGFLAVFDNPSDAVGFSAALQDSISREPILVGGSPLQVRVGIHAGRVVLRETSYGPEVFGSAVTTAARLTSAAPPGCIAISGTVSDLLSGERQAMLRPVAPFFDKNLPGSIAVSILDPREAVLQHELK